LRGFAFIDSCFEGGRKNRGTLSGSCLAGVARWIVQDGEARYVASAKASCREADAGLGDASTKPTASCRFRIESDAVEAGQDR
jgi:hypothetical protein